MAAKAPHEILVDSGFTALQAKAYLHAIREIVLERAESEPTRQRLSDSDFSGAQVDAVIEGLRRLGRQLRRSGRLRVET